MLGFSKKVNNPEKDPLAEKKESKMKRKENLRLLKAQKKDVKQSAKLHTEKLKQYEKRTDKANDERKKRVRKQRPPRTAQETIRYNRMFEDGICEIEEGIYSKSIKISDINYRIARRAEQEEIFYRYCEVLNYFDPSISVQISIVNRKIDKDEFQKTMFYELTGNPVLDPLCQEMNGVFSEKINEAESNTLREKYFTFSTSASSYSDAVPILARIESDLLDLLKSLGCDTHTLSGAERLELIYSMTCPESRFNWQYDTLVASSLSTKDAIAPSSFNFRDSKTQFGFGDNVGQILYLKDMPADLADNLVSEISDLPIDMTITLHVNSVEQDKALAIVNRAISFMDQQTLDEMSKKHNVTHGLTILPHELTHSREQAEELREDLEKRNQRMFKVTVLIYTFSDDIEKLNAQVKQIMAAARKKSCKVETLDYLQEEGFNSSLPLGKNRVGIQRTLTTASTAIFIPFTTQEICQKGGNYYGENALSGNPVICDRALLDAPMGVILGMPGSGKSMAAKQEEVSAILRDKNNYVVVIDPEGEYTEIARVLGGEVINISAGSSHCINPMDITMDYSDDADPLSLKNEFILTICELLIGGKDGLTPGQRSIISRATTFAYQPYFAKENEPMPTLKDFYNIIKAQPEPEAQTIALSLELYIDGKLSAFASQTNVDTQNRMLVFNVRDLGKQLRTFGMLVVLDQVWNRITRNYVLGNRTFIHVDEMQLLFTNEYSAEFFFELWSRSRKWGAIPTGITQNVETLLNSSLARRMLSNSGFKLLFNQAPADRAELAGLLKLSPDQLNHITKSPPGQGLLITDGATVPFVNDFPKDTGLYKAMTTKFKDEAKSSRSA